MRVMHKTALAIILGLSLAGQAGAGEMEFRHVGTPHQALFDIDFHGQQGLAVGAAGFLLRSEDGGKSWKRRHLQGVQGAVLGVDVGPETTLVVGQSGLILYSKPDGGWKQVASPTESRLFDVSANPGGLAVASGEFGTVLISRDGGKSWAKLPMPWGELNDQGLEPHLYAAKVDVTGVITLAGEFEMIIQSSDGGQTWTTLHSGKATIFDLTLLANGQGYAVGQDGLFLKFDPADAPSADLLAKADSNTLSDATQVDASGTDAEADQAPSGWRTVNLGSKTNLLGVAADQQGQVYVSGIRQFWISQDSGESWRAAEGERLRRSWFQSVSMNENGQFFTVGKSAALGLVSE